MEVLSKICFFLILNNSKFLNEKSVAPQKKDLLYQKPIIYLKRNFSSFLIEKKLLKKFNFYSVEIFVFLKKFLFFFPKNFIPLIKIKKLFWFRFELRINYNKILKKISTFPNHYVVLICLDSRILKFFGKKKLDFLKETIQNLKKNLKRKKINFLFENGYPEEIILKLNKYFNFKKILFYFEKNLHWNNTSKKEKELINYLFSFNLNSKILYFDLIFFDYNFLICLHKNFQNCFFFFLKYFLSIEIKKFIKKKFRKIFIFFYSKKKKNFVNRENFKDKFFFKKRINYCGGEDFVFLFLKILKIHDKKFFLFEIIKNCYYLKPWTDFGCISLKDIANFFFSENLYLNIFIFLNLFFKDFLVFLKIKKSNVTFR
jgi:hypothetical protein